jgi:hypothetical protein
MPQVCLLFRIHQSLHLAPYSFFDAGRCAEFFDLQASADALKLLCERSVLPLCETLDRLRTKLGADFKVAIFLSGTTLELMRAHHPKSIKAIHNLLVNGCVELMVGPYYNALPTHQAEFYEQIRLHSELTRELFGVTARFLNQGQGLVHKLLTGSQLHSEQGVLELSAQYKAVAAHAQQLILTIDPSEIFKVADGRDGEGSNLIEQLVTVFTEQLGFSFIDQSYFGPESAEAVKMLVQMELKNCSPCLENSMQKKACDQLYSAHSRASIPLETWRRLHDREYLLRMRIRRDDTLNDNNQDSSPYDAFIVFMNILRGAAAPSLNTAQRASGF